VANLRVVLDLDGGTVPCGRLAGPGREAITFAGWIELAAALEAVLTAPRPADGPPAPELSDPDASG
jgi:hypothetical protein